ncbi:unnamed protein product [Linum trigynum]|uniref:Glycine-rich protein n=1 Tax=Linum trigynum TaxID=586398 RepID=A0AAV2CE41_9ROSI
MARRYASFFALLFFAWLVHASARPVPTTTAAAADQKTFLPCIPKAAADAVLVQTSTFDVAPAPGGGAGVEEGKNFIYGGGVGGYAGFVGGFPLLGGVHYGGIGVGGAAAGGLLPCP